MSHILTGWHDRTKSVKAMSLQAIHVCERKVKELSLFFLSFLSSSDSFVSLTLACLLCLLLQINVLTMDRSNDRSCGELEFGGEFLGSVAAG